MTSDIKQSLNKHEMILERYKTLLFSDKNKTANQNTKNSKDPINQITSKTLKIKENIDLGINPNNINDFNTLNVDLNLNKTEKKIDEILSKANYTLFDKPNKNQIIIKEQKTLSSSEQVKKIVEENNRNKINEAKNTDKVSELIKKYETIDQINKKSTESADHRSYLENLRLDQQTKNMNLHNIIEKNNNLIENLKKKYLNNIQQNTASMPSYPSANCDFKFPIQKNYKENEANLFASSANSTILENLNTKGFSTINASGPFNKKFNEEADFDNQDTINKINLLRQKYLNDERPKSSMEINNKLFKEEAFPFQDKLINKEEISLSKDPQINSIINKYRSKLGSSISVDLSRENKIELIGDRNKGKIPESSIFNSKLEEVNKKIDGINFTFQKNEDNVLNFGGAKVNQEANENNENDKDDFFNRIINKKNEKEKKELVEKEKNENTDKYNNEYAEALNSDNYNCQNINEESKGKKGFIKKINFIEEKLNRIENLIKFEEQETNKNKRSDLMQTENFGEEEEEKNKIKNLNENASGYADNFTLANINSKNDFKSVKRSVFSEQNKIDDMTTDDEKQSNNILSFAQNIRKLKELKEKNNQMIEEITDTEKRREKRKDKGIAIPKDRKNKNRHSDFSDNFNSDKNESDNYEKFYYDKISRDKDEREESELNANKIINNLIENEKIFEGNNNDFIDEEMEKERKSVNSHLKKSIAGNQNSSVINNLTLSYSISSNEKSDEEANPEEEYYVKKGKNYEAGYMSNPSDEEGNSEAISLKEINENERENSPKLNKNVSFDNLSANSPKSNKSRSRLKKPIKKLISFDDFLNSNLE